MYKNYLFSISLACSIGITYGQTYRDIISWPTWTIEAELPKYNAGISIYGEYRIVSQISKLQLYLHSFSGYYNFKKYQITIGAGIVRGYIEGHGALYNRIGFISKHFDKGDFNELDIRLLFENPKTVPRITGEIAIPRNTRWGLLVGYLIKIKKTFGIYVYNDFYIYQDLLPFSENRFFIGPRLIFAKQCYVEIGYLHHWVKGEMGSTIEHGITGHFKFSFHI
jgi:hypothetical protein